MYELFLSKIRNIPLFLFLLTFFSFLFSATISKNSGNLGGILVLTLTMIPLIQITTKLIEREANISLTIKRKNIFYRHKDFIINYFAIFFGAVLASYISYLLYPNIFYPQIDAIHEIKSEILARASAIDKKAFAFYILINNIKVLLLFFLFSFIFGAGAIYELLWNSSIIGVFLGLKVQEISGDFFYKYITYPLYSLILLLPHGILEFLAYFLAALAGGIFSMSIIKNLKKEELEIILSDSIFLLIFSIVLLVTAAFIEAFL